MNDVRGPGGVAFLVDGKMYDRQAEVPDNQGTGPGLRRRRLYVIEHACCGSARLRELGVDQRP